ncbi:DUF6228 family protein [Actinacidiphila acididurans]|uniref:Permease n=1 Tax=Actinacidiphila acididurans TaxID=2784346 RepID=A0ABS2TYW0_9ACTN|nr:DUF6228 family protein [Actinacidiphila acididurans]MBM9508012.1 permease [Actinacidiphila acididurans]
MGLIEVGPGQVELVVRGAAGSPDVRVRLFDWAREDEYHVVFGIEASDNGVRARVGTVGVNVWDTLEDFFDGLARDFRGWEGERVWTANHLVVAATFGRGGHVRLSWTLRANVFDNGWQCTVSTVVEGGEEMTTLAADLRAFLGQG